MRRNELTQKISKEVERYGESKSIRRPNITLYFVSVKLKSTPQATRVLNAYQM